MQRRERAAEGLVVPTSPAHLVDRSRDEKVVLCDHDVGDGRSSRHLAQTPQPVGLVERPGTELGDERASPGLDNPRVAVESSGRSGGTESSAQDVPSQRAGGDDDSGIRA